MCALLRSALLRSLSRALAAAKRLPPTAALCVRLLCRRAAAGPARPSLGGPFPPAPPRPSRTLRGFGGRPPPRRRARGGGRGAGRPFAAIVPPLCAARKAGGPIGPPPPAAASALRSAPLGGVAAAALRGAPPGPAPCLGSSRLGPPALRWLGPPGRLRLRGLRLRLALGRPARGGGGPGGPLFALAPPGVFARLRRVAAP